MKKYTFSPQKELIPIFFGLFLIIVLTHCTAERVLTSAAHFRFQVDDQSFRIRSISSVDKGNSYNELIAKDFLAVDYDKDRILDKVILGDVTLAAAQKIYEFGLGILIEEDKVQVYNMAISDYIQVNSEYDYQIKSFHPEGSEPFNEFKIIRKRELIETEIVIIDQKADGVLDEVLKGPVEEVPDYQDRYAYVLNSGLEKDRLVKKGDMIVVKEK
jgi:hypothetical protein